MTAAAPVATYRVQLNGDFGFEDARRFLTERGRRNGWRIEQLDCEWDGCGNWKSPDGRELLADPNLRKGGLWCALEREP